MRNEPFFGGFRQTPDAVASVHGSPEYPAIRGKALFYTVHNGVMVHIRVRGLPRGSKPCRSPIFACHIHSGNACTGDETDAFADAGTHYNPEDCPHPYHAGDLPPLFGANGEAFSLFLTARFTVPEILGKVLILHGEADDFTTQPSGNAGEKIACGVISSFRM